MQISDAPWGDDASQGGIPMGAAMPLGTRARELIQAHPSIQQHHCCVAVSPRSCLSPPCQDRASSAPSAGTAGCQVAVAVRRPCDLQVSPGTNAAGDLPHSGWPAPSLPHTPAGASLRRPQPHPGAPSRRPPRGHALWHRGRRCPRARPEFQGSFNIYSTQREEQLEGWRCGVAAVPDAGREGERRERGRELSARARPGAAVGVAGPCGGDIPGAGEGES